MKEIKAIQEELANPYPDNRMTLRDFWWLQTICAKAQLYRHWFEESEQNRGRQKRRSTC
jgi:hypothetical protein